MNASPIPSSGQIKVLLVFANPRSTNPLQLGREERAIREAIRLSAHRERIEVTTCHAATIHDFRRALLTEAFQIVHISGHGTHRGLILENELGGEQSIPQSALAELLQAYNPPLQCVLLNACYSASQGHLISFGVPFTIAMEGPIGDRAAIEFSRGFYDALGAGRTIDFAYEEGCRTVHLAAPDIPFISQILADDDHSKRFSLQKDEPLPPGYACISLSTERVAIKPTRYQSVQMLLDDLYVHCLAEQYEPYTYGSMWVLASRSKWDDPEVLWSSRGDYRRLVLPWNWQLPLNNCRPVTQFDLSWGKTSLRSYGIEAGSYWAVLTPEASTLGLATNNQELAEDLSFSFRDRSLSPKELYFRLSEHRLRWASASEVCPDDYKFWFVLTDDPEETRSYLKSWMFLSDRHKGKNVRDTIILTQGPSN